MKYIIQITFILLLTCNLVLAQEATGPTPEELSQGAGDRGQDARKEELNPEPRTLNPENFNDEETSQTSETPNRDSEEKKSLADYDFPGLQNKISVDLRGMSMVDVFKFLAVEGDINIAIAPNVAGEVNLLINDVTIADIFEIVLSTNDLAFQVQGNVIKVITNSEYKALQGVDFHDARQTAIYKLKHVSAQNMGNLLGNIKSDVGKIIFDETTGMLVLLDTPMKIKEMEEIITKSEILPTETKVFELQYAKVEDISTEITAALTPHIGEMRTDIRTNTFVIKDMPHKLEEIDTILMAFDRRTREVFIEAKIVQVTLSDAFKWGIDWERLFSGRQAANLKGASITPEVNMPLSLTSFGKLTVSRTGSSTLDFVLEVLSTVGETKILSNPHIATEEGKEATINVITQQPYSQTTTTTTDAATTQSTEFTFVDVGVKLNVVPTINKDGYISMLIKPEVSSITSFFPDSASDQRVPVVETANAESSVLIKDGTTIIIAGMIKDTKSRSVNKIPLLGDVPVIGKLFSNLSDEIQRTETIVFITPRIITGDEPFMLERDRTKVTKGIRKLEQKATKPIKGIRK